MMRLISSRANRPQTENVTICDSRGGTGGASWARLFSFSTSWLELGLVAISVRFRLGPTTLDEATNDRWRFGFFIAWTLSLPLLWLWEWWGVEVGGFGGLAWKTPDVRGAMPELTYGRKVVSDMWTAFAAVLGLLAWNKRP